MRHGITLRALGSGLGVVGALALSGCLYGPGHVHHDRVVVIGGDPPPGPPDHAPAHGYRRKHGYHHTHSHKRPAPEPRVEVELRFDESLGVHVVVGHAGIYFHADHYYRLADSGWEWTAELGQAWVAAPDHGVPTGLRKLRNGKGPQKAKRGGERHGRPGPAPAKAEPPEKASPPHKVKPDRKARVSSEREDPGPEHRHQHDEYRGRGWN